MSQDFLFVSLPYADPTDEQKQRMAALIAKEKRKPTTCCVTGSIISPDEEDHVEYREELTDAFNQYCEGLANDSAVLHFEGMPYQILCTGGMSGGDLPTDSSEFFVTLGENEKVYALLREFAIEDFNKRS
jgi:hypothetical protein